MNKHYMIRHLLFVGMLAVLSACATVELEEPQTESGAPVVAAEQPLRVPPLAELPETAARPLKGHYRAASWAELPGWQTDDLQYVWRSLVNNCKGLMRPVSGSLAMPARAAPRAWQPFCQDVQRMGAQTLDAAQLRQFLQSRLQPWRLEQGNGQLATSVVTGYYEPVVNASRHRQGPYQWPLYAIPDDLLVVDLGSVYPELAGKRIRGKLQGRRIVPYDTRAEIAANPARQPRAIVWVNDPVEAFFLQVQGSGRARLTDGSVIRLAYADHNGRPYASIGQWLIRQGELTASQASMQGIKRWAQQNPGRVQELLNVNPAMVFFREEAVSDTITGPRGAYDIPLIARRSIAADPEFVPLGTPVFLATQYPAEARPLQRLMFVQDTGAAIKGAARADFYWGTGDEAGQIAGRMKQNGNMWLLWPAGAGQPAAR